ncbi:MAG: ATP-binding protein [Oscillospiraceae bacterium]
MMMNLFDYVQSEDKKEFHASQEGLRLQKLEVYNWGTFNQKIWNFTPQGETTLLTGDSGSGKSTLVDALITLLVSPRKTAYNKAADATAKERSVTSYVRGYYGQKYAYEGKGKPEALRDTNQYSVLLAVFEDKSLMQVVTLAICFWFKDQQSAPERFYTVAQKELSIEHDFSGFGGDTKQLRTMLKKNNCELFSDYNHYAEYYRKLLGDLSAQAIDLFQQTVSMKKVEALTDFVRSSMLEDSNILDEKDKLLKHYYDLNKAYESVQRSRNQAQRLQPICENGSRYSLRKADSIAVKQGQDTLELWYAMQKTTLYEQAVAQLKLDIDEAANRMDGEQQKLKNLENELKELEKAIDKNGGGRLETLRQELQRKKEALAVCSEALHRYTRYIDTLKLPIPKTNAEFLKIKADIDDMQAYLSHEQTESQNHLMEISMTKSGQESEFQSIQEEIFSLKKRTSNIPNSLILLREQICANLSVAPELLPFAGELLEVKETQVQWEGAIERLLHSFALSLLVPEQLYAQVADWVNEKQLGMRLVYFAVKPQSGETPKLHPYAVANKLEIKQPTAFSSWLTQEVAQRFSHICCDDLSLFRREKHAITKTGQIKSAARHEKDDRKNLSDRTQYVLGFSNQKKLVALSQKSSQLEQTIQQTQKQETQAKLHIEAIAKQTNATEELVGFSNFSQIETEIIEQAIERLQEQIAEIERNENGLLSALRKQKEFTSSQIGEQETFIETARNVHSRIKIDLENTQLAQVENSRKLELETTADQATYPYLEQNKHQFLDDVALTLKNSDVQEKRYTKALQEEQSKLQEKIADLKINIEKAMALFRRDFPEMAHETDDKIDSLSEYYRMLEQLQKDDLPKYETEFKNRLSSQMINQIVLFHASLRQQYEQVKQRIEDINGSLHKIDYNPQRYIRLNCEDNPDAEIRNFRTQLKACSEGTSYGFGDEEQEITRFLQIKDIIQRFDGREKETETDKRWTKKVTDVRNWFVFSASERLRENDEEYEHYTDSGGKSGGQKEKLAYTILAASLVYNYGLHQDYINQSTFRLVVIDEAFLKSSDDAAKYGLQLFGQLKFQMIIVTPLLKISTIEPFIAHVGFVSHYDITHQSSLANIPIEVYKEKRRNWEVKRFAELDRQ